MNATAQPEGSSQAMNGRSDTTDAVEDGKATKKSYSNNAWLQSRPARQVRMLCEYLEVRDRLRQHRILATFLVIGTARALTHDQWNKRMNAAMTLLRRLENDRKESDGAPVSDPEEVLAVEQEISHLRRLEWLCSFSEKVTRLTRRLAEWVLTDEARATVSSGVQQNNTWKTSDDNYTGRDKFGSQKARQGDCGHWPAYRGKNCFPFNDFRYQRFFPAICRPAKKILDEFPTPLDNAEEWGPESGSQSQQLVYCPVAICTGGGPGLMEAANKGASEVPGARTIGMGISLPFENGLNQYVTKELGFEFQYLFARKFWMVNTALGVIAAPGGFGTLDELMEVIALKQTNKLKRDIPIVLLGKTYWTSIINFDKMVEFGTINKKDCDQLFLTDDEDVAFEYIRSFLLGDKATSGEGYTQKSLARRHRE